MSMTPNGTSIVARLADGTEVDLTEAVQAVYDVGVNGMDLGFWLMSLEDALPLAQLAEVCGFGRRDILDAYVRQVQFEDEQREFSKRMATEVARLFPDQPLLNVHELHARGALKEHSFSQFTGRCLYAGCFVKR